MCQSDISTCFISLLNNLHCKQKINDRINQQTWKGRCLSEVKKGSMPHLNIVSYLHKKIKCKRIRKKNKKKKTTSELRWQRAPDVTCSIHFIHELSNVVNQGTNLSALILLSLVWNCWNPVASSSAHSNRQKCFNKTNSLKSETWSFLAV